MFELLRVVVALAGSAAAGLWDLKTTDIPDRLCIAMIIAGFGMHALEGFATGSWSMLVSALGVGLVFLAFGLLMYFLGGWGGGDSELLLAIVVLVPVWPFAQLSPFPFALSLFINVFLVGAVWSVAYSVVLASRDGRLRALLAREICARRTLAWSLLSAVVASALFMLTSRAMPLFIAGLVAVLVFLMPILYVFSKTIEGRAFRKRIPSAGLKKGDMIGEDIPRLGISKRQIRGLTEKEVSAIRRTKKLVWVREGIRYGIVFPVALALTLLLGDFAFLLFH